MSEELKPCPFCGGQANINFYGDENNSGSGYQYFIGCIKCKAEIGWHEYEANAQHAWNRRASPWVRVEDGLPDEGVYVFVKSNHYYSPSAAFYENKNWFERDDNDELDEEDGISQVFAVTHWMPIPELPEEE